MDEEEHENDPESSIDDIAFLLDDSDEANSLDSNYSTRTSNSIDLDDLILDQLNTELENNNWLLILHILNCLLFIFKSIDLWPYHQII